ncbi:restriction endonuclease subunit S [Caminicella sporogenes]|uniref:restriction endonuclease subunit S n=1 Tax=Caminicella sporogenes TaxID=166485 RepID=UPI002541F132|nr:restriction endonuclease subunit S [Caminicella sporogenes]WIF95097.1 restriction endonuclease subunit S [Caminicella sporogenes]
MARKKQKKKSLDELLKEALVPKKEWPYEVPENWVWVRFGYVADWQKGKKPKVLKEENKGGFIPYVTIGGFERGVIEYYADEKSTNAICDKDDILMVWDGARAGLVGIGAKGAVGSTLAIIKLNQINNKYLFYFLRSKYDYINANHRGTGIPHVDPNILKEMQLPLPPLAEQKRIVDKLEFLFGKINKAKELIEEARETFEKRRAAILAKAFKGELTAKWREEHPVGESAEILLSNIERHKAILSKKRKSNIKHLDEVDPPYELPEGWVWAKLGQLSFYITSGSRNWAKYYSTSGALFIRTQNINTNRLVLDNVVYVKLPENVEGKRSLVEQYDILTTITGANVGKCALVNEAIPEAYVSQSVALIKLVDKSIAKYIYLSMLSPEAGGGELTSLAYGIGRPVLSLENIRNIHIPLAPIEEQNEIVNIVEDLLNKEEETLNMIELDETIQMLEKSILAKAFRGELGTNNSDEESAIELLKNVLQEKFNLN